MNGVGVAGESARIGGGVLSHATRSVSSANTQQRNMIAPGDTRWTEKIGDRHDATANIRCGHAAARARRIVHVTSFLHFRCD